MGLNVCQNNFFSEYKEDKEIDESWLQLYDKACSFRMNFHPLYEQNKNNIKTREYKKIFNNLQSCIVLILDKMNDYINLDLLVDLIYSRCEKNLREFYIFLDKSFYAFRRTETILNSGKNLMSTSVLIQYDILGKIKTEGKYINYKRNKCDFCKNYITTQVSYSFKLFECGHRYHLNCLAEENGEKVCYICTKQEIGDNSERAQNFKEGNIQIEMSDKEKQVQEKNKKEAEERKKRTDTKNRLNALKKIRKKRREINSVLKGNDIYGMN